MHAHYCLQVLHVTVPNLHQWSDNDIMYSRYYINFITRDMTMAFTYPLTSNDFTSESLEGVQNQKIQALCTSSH